LTSSPDDLTLRTAKLAALCCCVIAALYAGLDAEPSLQVAGFYNAAPLFFVIIWLDKDGRRTGVGSLLDWGASLGMAWPVAVPWYVFKTRGLAGWRLLLGLTFLIFSATITWFVVAWIAYGIRYALWYREFGS
jgi:hypothetical protein